MHAHMLVDHPSGLGVTGRELLNAKLPGSPRLGQLQCSRTESAGALGLDSSLLRQCSPCVGMHFGSFCEVLFRPYPNEATVQTWKVVYIFVQHILLQ